MNTEEVNTAYEKMQVISTMRSKCERCGEKAYPNETSVTLCHACKSQMKRYIGCVDCE